MDLENATFTKWWILNGWNVNWTMPLKWYLKKMCDLIFLIPCQEFGPSCNVVFVESQYIYSFSSTTVKSQSWPKAGNVLGRKGNASLIHCKTRKEEVFTAHTGFRVMCNRKENTVCSIFVFFFASSRPVILCLRTDFIVYHQINPNMLLTALKDVAL